MNLKEALRHDRAMLHTSSFWITTIRYSIHLAKFAIFIEKNLQQLESGLKLIKVCFPLSSSLACNYKIMVNVNSGTDTDMPSPQGGFSLSQSGERS